jgi:HSP90 family molecular chaperone
MFVLVYLQNNHMCFKKLISECFCSQLNVYLNGVLLEQAKNHVLPRYVNFIHLKDKRKGK